VLFHFVQNAYPASSALTKLPIQKMMCRDSKTVD